MSHVGQTQPMTTAIANIIRDYNSGQVIQELLQNCDDARARNVVFILDKREQCCNLGASELGKALSSFVGPALIQYDDAIFLEKDFASLQYTGDSRKKVHTVEENDLFKLLIIPLPDFSLRWTQLRPANLVSALTGVLIFETRY